MGVGVGVGAGVAGVGGVDGEAIVPTPGGFPLPQSTTAENGFSQPQTKLISPQIFVAWH